MQVLEQENLVCKQRKILDSFADWMAYRKGGFANSFYSGFCGDNKPRRAGEKPEFTDEEKGHLKSFLCELLSLEPFRSFAIGS